MKQRKTFLSSFTHIIDSQLTFRLQLCQLTSQILVSTLTKTIDMQTIFEKKDDYATRDHVRTAYAMIG